MQNVSVENQQMFLSLIESQYLCHILSYKYLYVSHIVYFWVMCVYVTLIVITLETWQHFVRQTLCHQVLKFCLKMQTYYSVKYELQCPSLSVKSKSVYGLFYSAVSFVNVSLLEPPSVEFASCILFIGKCNQLLFAVQLNDFQITTHNKNYLCNRGLLNLDDFISWS